MENQNVIEKRIHNILEAMDDPSVPIKDNRSHTEDVEEVKAYDEILRANRELSDKIRHNHTSDELELKKFEDAKQMNQQKEQHRASEENRRIDIERNKEWYRHIEANDQNALDNLKEANRASEENRKIDLELKKVALDEVREANRHQEALKQANRTAIVEVTKVVAETGVAIAGVKAGVDVMGKFMKWDEDNVLSKQVLNVFNYAKGFFFGKRI